MEKPPVKYDLEIARGTIYDDLEMQAVVEAIRAGAASCGGKVKQFEDAFTSYCGTEYGLAVTSATTGLTLAGIAAGVGRDDEVITTPISWISTASAFATLGARVTFCDVDPRSLNMDPASLEAKITPKTKAIVPIHLFGQCCDMDGIMAVARKHGTTVIEDCAHSPGALFCGRKAGSLGDIGVFSFHQQKNMSTLGEGGMVTTSNRRFFESMLSYRSLCCRTYGKSDKYLSIDESRYPMGKEYWRLTFDDDGYNFRMTDVQAAAGLVQLGKLDGFNEVRRRLSNRLTSGLEGIGGLTLPWIDPRCFHVFHLYVVQIEKGFPLNKREFMWEMCTSRGIRVWSNYMPIHLTQPYVARGHQPGECPEAEAAFDRYVSLPLHPRLTEEAIDYMAESIRDIGKAGR